MRCATVVGPVWATKRLEALPSGALIEIELDGADRERIVAYDVLGCGDGERVLVALGSTAASWFPDGPRPIDALIVGSLDQPERAVQRPGRKEAP
jgi:ethanolamine utilization protein EutN